MSDIQFYTIGYAGRSIDQFLDLLKARNVKIVVDVRFNPVSRFRPEFSKNRLKEALESNGIRYMHYPELGVPKDIRKKLMETGDYEWFFKWYDENVIAAQTAKLDNLTALDHPIAIMCTESDAARCHRSRIASYLEGKGLRVEKL